jgi:hypothetical protein
LRELGGLLAIEIEGVLFAVGNRDTAWVARLVTRHTARHATNLPGKPLAANPRNRATMRSWNAFACG